jgi:hypothetical protein
MKWSKGWEPRFRLHIGFFHSLLGRRLMVAQRENKGRLTQPLGGPPRASAPPLCLLPHTPRIAPFFGLRTRDTHCLRTGGTGCVPGRAARSGGTGLPLGIPVGFPRVATAAAPAFPAALTAVGEGDKLNAGLTPY